MITIYTDGACIGNPGIGGYAAIIQNRTETLISGGYKHTTNNRMELLAVIKSLEHIKEKSEITVYSDAKYVVNAFQLGWVNSWQRTNFKNQKILNVDLWKRLIELSNFHKVTFRWVRGHDGNPTNERCDKLAAKAARSVNLSIDFGYKK